MQLILRKHWKLWVVGNHVDPKASYCNKTFRRRQWLHKLLVYGELVQDGMSQCCQPTLQSNFTRVTYDAQQFRWHEEAGPVKGRRMEEVYCALCKDEAAVCSNLLRARVYSSKYVRRDPHGTIRPGGRSALGKLSYNYTCMSYSEVKESSLMRSPTYLWMIKKCQESNWLTET